MLPSPPPPKKTNKLGNWEEIRQTKSQERRKVSLKGKDKGPGNEEGQGRESRPHCSRGVWDGAVPVTKDSIGAVCISGLDSDQRQNTLGYSHFRIFTVKTPKSLLFIMTLP